MCEAPWIFPSRISRSSKADLGCTSRSLNLLAIDPISTKPPIIKSIFPRFKKLLFPRSRMIRDVFVILLD